MSQTNGDFFQGLETPPPGDFSGQTTVGLAEILQSTCRARHSGQLTFRSGPSYGYLFLQQGQVVHAMCGTVEGEEAVYLMLSWPPGTFVLNEDILPHKRTISATWEQLLFEGARRADVGAVTPDNLTPVTTAHPLTKTRADSQPKLIVSQGDGQPTTVELQHEYTHLGRTEDNELPIPEPSISSRHCVFILSGSDVIVRDLNSSNGTYVNGEPVTETILQPGDNIQVGVIDIKFVPGVRRPKLNTSSMTPVKPRAAGAIPPGAETTLKLPSTHARRPGPAIAEDPKNKAFVSGSSAISYDQLATDVPQPKRSWGLTVVLIILIILIAAAAAAYFLVLKH